MNDKCAGGTGAVIDKINAKLHIPPEQLCDMGYTGIKLHPVAGKCGVFAETDVNSPAEDGRAERPADGVAVRRDHRPEPVRADARQHAAARGAAARRPEHVHPRHGRGVAGQHPADLGGARHAAARGRRPAGPDQGPRERPVLRGARRGRVRPVRGGRTSASTAAPSSCATTSTSAASRRRRRRAARASSETPEELEAFQRALHDPRVHAGRRSSPARWSRRSSASTAARPPPRRCCSTRTATSSSRATSSPRATRSSTPRRCSASCEQYVAGPGRHPRGAGHRHHRLRQGHPEGRPRAPTWRWSRPSRTPSRRCSSTTTSTCIVRRRRPGHQAHHPEEPAGQGLQAQHPVLGRQRLLPAVDRRGLRLQRRRLRRHRVQRADDADVRLRLRGVHAVGHRRLPAPGLEARGDHGRPRRRAAQEHLALRLADPEPRGARHATSCCRAARSTTWRRSRRRSTSSSRASRARTCSRGSSCTSTAASPARSAPASRRCACGRTAARPSSSAWTRSATSRFVTHRNEDTRCYFCKNKCLRTFIDVTVEGSRRRRLRPPVEDRDPARRQAPDRRQLVRARPGRGRRVDEGHQEGHGRAGRGRPELRGARRRGGLAQPEPAEGGRRRPRKTALTAAASAGATSWCAKRETLRIGIPRVLNQYSVNPLFSAYFESLGVPPQNLVYSSFTNEEMYKQGAKRGAIDPCFPSQDRHPARARPAARGTQEASARRHLLPDDRRAAVAPVVHAVATARARRSPRRPRRSRRRSRRRATSSPSSASSTSTRSSTSTSRACSRSRCSTSGRTCSGLTQAENERAVAAGYEAQRGVRPQPARSRPARCSTSSCAEQTPRRRRARPAVPQRPGRQPRDPRRVPEDRLPGLHAGLAADRRRHHVGRCSARTSRPGASRTRSTSPTSGRTATPRTPSRKVWAAKYVAKHPNLVALELSSFKCGHDAPIYSVVEEIVQKAGTPYFCFKDIDENKADRLDQDPRRDDRLLPAALPRGHDEARPASSPPSTSGSPSWSASSGRSSEPTRRCRSWPAARSSTP